MLAILIRREVPTGLGFGLFFAIGAIAMAIQTVKAYRSGFMYCGRTEKVYRNQDSVRFKIWLVIQMSFVLFLTAFSIYAFLN
jgi:hypothetical protein